MNINTDFTGGNILVKEQTENAYFGQEDNKVSQENLVEFGRCFAKTIKAYA